jgi:hypothetical protein
MLLLVIGGVVLVIAVALVARRAATLPRAHVVRVRGRFPTAPPLEVYAALRDVVGAQAWRTGLRKVEILSHEGEPLRWRETGKGGAITYVREESVMPSRLVYRLDDARLPYSGRWILEVRPEGKEGSVLEITEEGEVRSAFFRLMVHYVFGYYRTMEQYLRDLGRYLDEPVEPERMPV